jgi:hypothetical protein
MALWDASFGWVTMVVRAESAEEARAIAVDCLRSRKMNETADKAEADLDRPLRLVIEGPAELLVDNID